MIGRIYDRRSVSNVRRYGITKQSHISDERLTKHILLSIFKRWHLNESLRRKRERKLRLSNLGLCQSRVVFTLRAKCIVILSELSTTN